ncbi:19950_t:CDS:2, partial [Gigaspora rosea]
GLNKRKIKLQKISELPFIPKRLRTSWNIIQHFTNIEDELWKRCNYEDEKRITNYRIIQQGENTKDGIIPTASISNSNTSTPIRIKNECWPSINKVFLTAILVIISICIKEKTITIDNNVDKTAKISTLIMKENAYDISILNEQHGWLIKIIRSIIMSKELNIVLNYKEKINLVEHFDLEKKYCNLNSSYYHQSLGAKQFERSFKAGLNCNEAFSEESALNGVYNFFKLCCNSSDSSLFDGTLFDSTNNDLCNVLRDDLSIVPGADLYDVPSDDSYIVPSDYSCNVPGY